MKLKINLKKGYNMANNNSIQDFLNNFNVDEIKTAAQQAAQANGQQAQQLNVLPGEQLDTTTVAQKSGSGAGDKAEVKAEVKIDTKVDTKAAKKLKKAFVNPDVLKDAKSQLDKKLPTTLGEALYWTPSKKVTEDVILEWTAIFFKEIRKQYLGKDNVKVKMDTAVEITNPVGDSMTIDWKKINTSDKLAILKSIYEQRLNTLRENLEKVKATKVLNLKLEVYRTLAIDPIFCQLVNKANSQLNVEGV
jgi:hypothetical protein